MPYDPRINKLISDLRADVDRLTAEKEALSARVEKLEKAGVGSGSSARASSRKKTSKKKATHRKAA